LGELANILATAKGYKGFTRKSQIGEIAKIMGEQQFDDAGILELGDTKLVVSTDGIAEELVKSDPWFAGYYSVMVNVNDVVVKGAQPLGFVNVISSPSRETRVKIALGIRAGLDKYDLQLLKGHTHPDSSYEAVDAAVVGVARKVVRGTTASPGDLIAIAIDLDGSFGVKGWVKTFDSTLKKSKTEISRMIKAIINTIEAGKIKASRDMSAPGILGTLTMLCEASSVGAEIDLEKIPKPNNCDLIEWLISYPAMGFIFAVESESALEQLRKVGLETKIVGKFTKAATIKARLHGEVETFIDLSKESIFGLR
jgi:hypothetical protein